MSKVSDSVSLFTSGCACSQAILAIYGVSFGIDRQTALKVAAGFAGGMRMGATCGAATGAIMVLGLAHCAVDDQGKTDRRKDLRAGPGASETLRHALRGPCLQRPDGLRHEQSARDRICQQGRPVSVSLSAVRPGRGGDPRRDAVAEETCDSV